MTPPVLSMDQKAAVDMPRVEEVSRPSPAKKRGLLWLALAVVLAAVIGGGVALGAVAIYNSHRPNENFQMGTTYPQGRVPEHVTVDYQKQIIYVNEERVGQLGGLNYLHHFDRRLTAIRDLVNRRCYITPQEGNFREVVNWFSSNDGKNLSTEPRGFRFLPQQIDSGVVRSFGGPEIAGHCDTLPAYWILPELDEDVSKVAPANKTVDLQCSDGSSFDPQTSTCSGQNGNREKRAVRYYLLIIRYSSGLIRYFLVRVNSP